MKYQAIFIDLDGTLLNSDHQLSEFNQQVVSFIANELNIPVILSSGRPPQGMLPFYKALLLKKPMISFNGGLVNNPYDNKILFENIITLPVARTILNNLSGKTSINFNYFYEFEWFCMDKDYWVLQEESIINARATKTESLENLSATYDGELKFHKIIGVGEEKDIEKESQNFNTLNLPVNTLRSTPNFLDFMAHNISKGTALEKLCYKFGWDISQVIAFGDGENDIEMLQKAGLSVAMDNAKPEVKAFSDYVTGNNNNNGVGTFLEKAFSI
jgi:Cof subfamily protein (haloacid dehalogenase superfamily)